MLKYTGERVIPKHDDKSAQGNYAIHELMYMEFLEPTIGKIVIDVACGCGHGSKMIAEKAKKVFAYDISKDAIEFANKYYSAPNIYYQVCDILDLPHENESIDTVVSVEVFEHVLPIERVISEVHRVLAPKGFWCFTTPSGERYPDHSIVPWHVKHYTKQNLQELLKDHFNFAIRDVGIEPDSSVYIGKPVFANYSVFCVKK